MDSASARRQRRATSTRAFRPGDALIFGRESVGLSDELLAAHPDSVFGIPRSGAVRSLNLANAASIVRLRGAAADGGARQDVHGLRPPARSTSDAALAPVKSPEMVIVLRRRRARSARRFRRAAAQVKPDEMRPGVRERSADGGGAPGGVPSISIVAFGVGENARRALGSVIEAGSWWGSGSRSGPRRSGSRSGSGSRSRSGSRARSGRGAATVVAGARRGRLLRSRRRVIRAKRPRRAVPLPPRRRPRTARRRDWACELGGLPSAGRPASLLVVHPSRRHVGRRGFVRRRGARCGALLFERSRGERARHIGDRCDLGSRRVVGCWWRLRIASELRHSGADFAGEIAEICARSGTFAGGERALLRFAGALEDRARARFRSARRAAPSAGSMLDSGGTGCCIALSDSSGVARRNGAILVHDS